MNFWRGFDRSHDAAGVCVEHFNLVLMRNVYSTSRRIHCNIVPTPVARNGVLLDDLVSALHGCGNVGGFRLGIVLLLELAKFSPAGVLLGLGGIGIFFALEPEAEPIQVSRL